MADVAIFIVSCLGIALGIGVIVHAVRLRRGRTAETREWAFGDEQKARLRILMLPGSGCFYAAAGLFGLTRFTDAVGPLLALLVLVGFVPVFWAVLQLPMPLFFYPKWARERRSRIRARAKAVKGR